MTSMLRRAFLALACVLLGAPASFAGVDRYFDSNGVKIHYTIDGQGEPVLLIHGFAANIPLQWTIPGIIGKLSRDYQVIAFDNRGHGFSGKPRDPKQYGMEMVDDAVRLLDHLGIARAHVVSYSMGAMIASKLMALHPNRVLSVTLGGGAGLRETTNIGFFDRLADDLESGKGIGALIVALTPIGRLPPTEKQLRSIDWLFSTFNDPKVLAAVVRSWKELVVPEKQWRKIKVPTLAIVGANDPLRDNVDEIKEIMPAMKVVVIPRLDHMTTFDSPAFVRNVQSFLAEHRQAAATRHDVAAP
jgi:pimeloyl-ACP methyl ester carboxylesterase